MFMRRATISLSFVGLMHCGANPDGTSDPASSFAESQASEDADAGLRLIEKPGKVQNLWQNGDQWFWKASGFNWLGVNSANDYCVLTAISGVVNGSGALILDTASNGDWYVSVPSGATIQAHCVPWGAFTGARAFNMSGLITATAANGGSGWVSLWGPANAQGNGDSFCTLAGVTGPTNGGWISVSNAEGYNAQGVPSQMAAYNPATMTFGSRCISFSTYVTVYPAHYMPGSPPYVGQTSHSYGLPSDAQALCGITGYWGGNNSGFLDNGYIAIEVASGSVNNTQSLINGANNNGQYPTAYADCIYYTLH